MAADTATNRAVVLYAKDNAPVTPKLEDLPLRESVSQYGIIWTFEKPARVSQFINGDWYVEATGKDYDKAWARQGWAWDPFVSEMWAKHRPTLAAPTDGWKQKHDDRYYRAAIEKSRNAAHSVPTHTNTERAFYFWRPSTLFTSTSSAPSTPPAGSAPSFALALPAMPSLNCPEHAVPEEAAG